MEWTAKLVLSGAALAIIGGVVVASGGALAPVTATGVVARMCYWLTFGLTRSAKNNRVMHEKAAFDQWVVDSEELVVREHASIRAYLKSYQGYSGQVVKTLR